MSESQDKIIVCFDATELDAKQMCDFRWHAFHHLHLRPKVKESHFERGSLLHYFLELYYTVKREYKVVDQEYLEKIIEKGREKSIDYPSMTLEEIGETVFQFREYHRYYEEETIVPVYIEQPFTKEIYEDDDIRILISGKIDLVFHYQNSSQLCVLDHKRVAREFPYSPLRNQFKLYCVAMGTDTFILNKVGFQKTLKPAERFKRLPYIYSPEILDEWKQEVVYTAKDMVLKYQADYFPHNNTSCEKFNGCYLQRYCTTKPKAREFLIGTEYIVGEPWDVGSEL